MKFEIMSLDEEDYLHVEMENNSEKCYLLMSILQDLGCTIHKYYWRSKLDETYLELFEPKIFDVFDFIVDIIGNRQQFLTAFEIYKERVKILEKLLSLNIPYTEEDIKKTASKLVGLILEDNRKMA